MLPVDSMAALEVRALIHEAVRALARSRSSRGPLPETRLPVRSASAMATAARSSSRKAAALAPICLGAPLR